MAYRWIGWPSYIFPAPSHVLDGIAGLLNLNTAFGDPLHHGWPAAQDQPLVGTMELHRAMRSVPATWPHWARLACGWVLSTALLPGILISVVRLAIGFVISVFLGAILGAAMWRFEPLDRFFGPLFLGFQTLPSVCWVPMAVILFGFSEAGLMFVLVLGSFFSVAIALRDGLRTIPPLYQRAGKMLGASGWRLYRYVLLPASLPALASSLRQGFSFAWRSLMGAELIMVGVGHEGLGGLLGDAQSANWIGQIVAVMIVMVMIGIAADRLVFAKVEQKVYSRFGLAEA